MNKDQIEWLRNKILSSPSYRRVLEHLVNLGDNTHKWEATWNRTQPGIAECLGCARSRISLIVQEGISAGFVESRRRHITGGPSDGRGRNAYFITPEGRLALKT